MPWQIDASVVPNPAIAQSPDRPQFLRVTWNFKNTDTNATAQYAEQYVPDASAAPRLAADWLRQYNLVASQLASPIPDSAQKAGVAGQLNAFAPRLKAEIAGDPVGLGYGAWAGAADDARIYGILTDAARRPYSVPQVLVVSYRVVNCFDPTEYAGLTQIQLARLSTLLSAGQVDMQSSAVRQIAAAIFPVGGPTQTALVALWNAAKPPTTQSRAAELGLAAVQASDVAFARTN